MASKRIELGDDADQQMFRNYGTALQLWAKRFNTAEIAHHLQQPEHVVQRWIWHWRELSHSPEAGGDT